MRFDDVEANAELAAWRRRWGVPPEALPALADLGGPGAHPAADRLPAGALDELADIRARVAQAVREGQDLDG